MTAIQAKVNRVRYALHAAISTGPADVAMPLASVEAVPRPERAPETASRPAPPRKARRRAVRI